MYLQLENIVRQWRGKRVLVVGDAMLDVDMDVVSSRRSPEGSDALLVKQGRMAPGGAANAAANIQSMGGKATLVSVVGVDSNAHHLGGMLVDAGVEWAPVEDWDRPTTTKLRYGPKLRVDTESTDPLSKLKLRELSRVLQDAVHAQPDAILLSDYGKGMLCPQVLAWLAMLTVGTRIPVVWDPACAVPCAEATATCMVTAVTPNLEELRTMTGVRQRKAARRKLAAMLHPRTTIVATEGPAGAVVRRTEQECRVRTKRVRGGGTPRGAGDTFAAAVTLALAAGADILRAAALGNAAARVAVLLPGTVAVPRLEVMAELEEVALQNQGLLRQQLKSGMF